LGNIRYPNSHRSKEERKKQTDQARALNNTSPEAPALTSSQFTTKPVPASSRTSPALSSRAFQVRRRNTHRVIYSQAFLTPRFLPKNLAIEVQKIAPKDITLTSASMSDLATLKRPLYWRRGLLVRGIENREVE